MKKAKLFSIFLFILLAIAQFSLVSAAPSHDVADSISGTVIKIELKTDASSGESTVWVTVLDVQGQEQIFQVSLETALEWHLLVYENDVLVPNKALLNTEIDIPISSVIPDDDSEILHPVASALATFFSEEIDGVDYDLIIGAHEDGYGFGVIAQALWLTKKLDGDSETLIKILEAKESGDYGEFTLEDGTTFSNWGHFKQAVMDGDKKGNLGVVMSGKDKEKDNSDKQGNNGDQGNTGNNGNNGNNENNGNGGTQGNTNDNGNNGNKGDNSSNGNKDKQ
jgi:hypothetical protein